MKFQASVWVFQGTGAKFPSAIYSTKENAEKLIKHNKLTGILTNYPLDAFVYDWAIENNHFTPQKESESTKEFKQNFTSGSQEHYHYEDGALD